MPFTKAQILAAPPSVVDDYVAEQVMQWSRAASVRLLSGASVDQATMVENTGNSAVSRVDGSAVQNGAPNFVLYTKPPDFASADWPQRIIHKMAQRGYTFEYRIVGENAAAVFYQGTRPASPDYVEVPNGGDAVRRAALLAVQ